MSPMDKWDEVDPQLAAKDREIAKLKKRIELLEFHRETLEEIVDRLMDKSIERFLEKMERLKKSL